MENNNDQERILKYLMGRMDDDERVAFEIECEKELSLSEEVEYYKDIAATVFNDAAKREYSMRELLLKKEDEILSRQNKVVKFPFVAIDDPHRKAAFANDDNDMDGLRKREEEKILEEAAKRRPPREAFEKYRERMEQLEREKSASVIGNESKEDRRVASVASKASWEWAIILVLILLLAVLLILHL